VDGTDGHLGHYEIDAVVRWSVFAKVGRNADGTVGEVAMRTTVAVDAIQAGATRQDEELLQRAEAEHLR
jgi:hypothetical protein